VGQENSSLCELQDPERSNYYYFVSITTLNVSEILMVYHLLCDRLKLGTNVGLRASPPVLSMSLWIIKLNVHYYSCMS